MVDEARLAETEGGLEPAGDGWFVVNVRDASGWRHETFGASARFESPDAPFPQLGINIRVLEPGQPNCLYHGESAQEDFLVLQGECVLVVEGEERRLQAWDFVHLPPWTEHVTVGAGAGPCVVLMVGARDPDEELLYPVSEVAARHGASVAEETRDAGQAYAAYPGRHRVPLHDPRLPWNP